LKTIFSKKRGAAGRLYRLGSMGRGAERLTAGLEPSPRKIYMKSVDGPAKTAGSEGRRGRPLQNAAKGCHGANCPWAFSYTIFLRGSDGRRPFAPDRQRLLFFLNLYSAFGCCGTGPVCWLFAAVEVGGTFVDSGFAIRSLFGFLKVRGGGAVRRGRGREKEWQVAKGRRFFGDGFSGRFLMVGARGERWVPGDFLNGIFLPVGVFLPDIFWSEGLVWRWFFSGGRLAATGKL